MTTHILNKGEATTHFLEGCNQLSHWVPDSWEHGCAGRFGQGEIRFLEKQVGNSGMCSESSPLKQAAASLYSMRNHLGQKYL